ncbi:hypothetical protein JTE90_021352 [Oedothorax gibbosus]|uniref:Uncharacterized protein n=1 Tax=Oedothorax gibbosus TaxID=931172 RepID=A0AAV6TY85_9ARAC|nr:hypothetical protein JTE90_021352 [Oedothorax gibbosus]
MTQVMLPYILPLLLGRTFNLDKMEVGIDIFPKSVIENPKVIENPVTETHYKVVDNAKESRNLLDVDGSFSLNVKGGLFKAGASGAYLSDTYNRESTVEVAIRAMYRVVTEQIPDDAKPYDLWRTMGDAVGTHFVRSITYGGELIASVRLECNNTRDKQRIKGAVDVGGRIEIFDIGVEVEGEYMKDVAKSVESTQIKVFSSIPMSKVPNDMDSLKEALNKFPDDLANFNKGRGIPIRMELWPLSLLDKSLPDKIRNRVLEANLDDFEQKFDDLTNTKRAVSDWMKTMYRPLSEEHEKKIGDFYSELQKTIRPFYEVIGSLDMTKSSDQLKPANEAYGSSIPGVWYKKYLLLRQVVARDQGAWTRSRGNGATYVYWGRNNCTEDAEIMSTGFAMSTGPPHSGGGANFLCLPEKPQYGNPVTNEKEAAFLQNLNYQFPGGDSSKLSCATCRLASRGSVSTFIGRGSECPGDWDYVYDGLLASGSKSSFSTQFVCLDRNPVNNEGGDEDPLKPDWANIVGEEDGDKQILITCVVCAK